MGLMTFHGSLSLFDVVVVVVVVVVMHYGTNSAFYNGTRVFFRERTSLG